MANWDRLKIVADSIVRHLDRMDQIELLERLAVYYYDDQERAIETQLERPSEGAAAPVAQVVEPVPRIQISTRYQAER